jgi:SulP family sulfate permease
MEQLLRREKCLRDDQVCVALPELDRALERCEEAILAETSREATSPSISKELALAMGGEAIAKSFLSYAERITLNPGEYVMKQGDPSLELYVIESGRVSILLERANQPPLRLRSVTSNTCLGEIGLYRKGLRTASVVADEPTVVYRLRQSELTRMEDSEPKVAMAFHIFIIKTLADRLVASDKAIAALER